MELQPFFCTKPHPVAYCSVPCPLAMAEPALLWTAADMREREDGRYEYIPTQVFDNPLALSSVHWQSPPLARQRLQMMSATHHTNTTVGNIYVGNCVEPMHWAGEHVGYIIDTSHGTSNVRLYEPHFPLPHGSISA
jgi:hypothetical protein